MSDYNDARALWPVAGDVLHGFTTADLTKLARYAVKRSLQLGQIPADASLGECAEFATAGIVDALVDADSKPTDLALMRAGQNEIRRQCRRKFLYDVGLTAHGTPNRNYFRYWGAEIIAQREELAA